MADDYEQKFMQGGAAVYAERHVARVFTALMAIPALMAFLAGIMILLSPRAPAAAAIAPFFASAVVAFSALFWAVMRITVTADKLHVDYGMLGVKIPLSAIKSCALSAQLGTGAKWSPGGWRYGPLGTTRGISVEWSEGGATKRCYIGSRDPEALMKHVLAGQGARGRIAQSAGAAEEADRLLREAEAEAEEAAKGDSKAGAGGVV
jgi:hypothetical protein